MFFALSARFVLKMCSIRFRDYISRFAYGKIRKLLACTCYRFTAYDVMMIHMMSYDIYDPTALCVQNHNVS